MSQSPFDITINTFLNPHGYTEFHCNSTLNDLFYWRKQNLTQFIKILLVKLSEMLDLSSFLRLFHRQSFALYGTHTHIATHTYTHTLTHTYVHTYTHMHVYIFMCMCMFVCVCMCMHAHELHVVIAMCLASIFTI